MFLYFSPTTTIRKYRRRNTKKNFTPVIFFVQHRLAVSNDLSTETQKMGSWWLKPCRLKPLENIVFHCGSITREFAGSKDIRGVFITLNRGVERLYVYTWTAVILYWKGKDVKKNEKLRDLTAYLHFILQKKWTKNRNSHCLARAALNYCTWYYIIRVSSLVKTLNIIGYVFRA